MLTGLHIKQQVANAAVSGMERSLLLFGSASELHRTAGSGGMRLDDEWSCLKRKAGAPNLILSIATVK